MRLFNKRICSTIAWRRLYKAGSDALDIYRVKQAETCFTRAILKSCTVEQRAMSYHMLGIAQRIDRNHSSARVNLTHAKELAESTNNETLIARILRDIAE